MRADQNLKNRKLFPFNETKHLASMAGLPYELFVVTDRPFLQDLFKLDCNKERNGTADHA